MAAGSARHEGSRTEEQNRTVLEARCLIEMFQAYCIHEIVLRSRAETVAQRGEG